MEMQKAKRLLHILKERFTGAEVNTTSVIIAFYLLLSVFPLLIVAGNILSFFSVDALSAMGYLEVALPDPVMSQLGPIILSLLENSSGGLFSVSLLAAIWSASRGIGFVQRGVNKAYGLPNASNFIMRRLVSLLTVLLILLLLIAFLLVGSLGQLAQEVLSPHFEWAAGLISSIMALKWPVAILFVFALMVLLYRVTPDAKVRIRDTFPGALLATIGLLALVQGFTLYIRFSTRSFSTYGTLAGFFVLMFWLNFSAMILLVGAVLNATIQEYRFGRAEEHLGRVDTMIENTRETLAGRLKRRMNRRMERKVKKELTGGKEKRGKD